jgi:hypothetical protein
MFGELHHFSIYGEDLPLVSSNGVDLRRIRDMIT